MKTLATTFQALALVAILVTSPVGQWFCSIGESSCTPTDANLVEASDCCGESPESSCCFEVASDWQVVPSNGGVSPPDPAPAGISAFFLTEGSSAWPEPRTTGSVPPGWTDPPPSARVSAQALYCIRLI